MPSSSSAAVWLVLLVALVGANLPFVNERIFIVGPRRAPKSLGWRLLELVVLWAATIGVGLLLEARQGQIQPQRWEFYAAIGFFFLTLAFPGFVWRYLKKALMDQNPVESAGAGAEAAPPLADSHLREADSHLREETLLSEQVYRGRLLDVRRDQVRMPDGATAQREYIIHPGAVMVVPLLADGRLVVERQWRYPLGRAMLEFPAGKLDSGEPPQDCAKRELAEETGYVAAEWARAGILHNAIAYSNEGIEVWFARGLTLGERRLDAGEFLDVSTISVDELAALAASGQLTDAKTLIGLLWLQNVNAGRWTLDWHPAP